MEQRLKQRLVGATVLVLFVVIFVPELFEAPPAPPSTDVGDAEDSFNSRIVVAETPAPSLPEPEPMEKPATSDSTDVVVTPISNVESTRAAIEPVDEQALQASTARAEALALELSSELRPSTPKPLFKPTYSFGVDGETGAEWVVQLASFSESARATTLRDELLKDGYAAFIKTAANEAGTFSRVLVGPARDRDQADALRAKLLDQTRLEGRVIQLK